MIWPEKYDSKSEYRPEHIDGEFAVELSHGDRLEGFKFEDAGVVHQYVELAKGFLRLRKKPFHLFGIGDVGSDGNSISASVGNFGEHPIGAFPARCIVITFFIYIYL